MHEQDQERDSGRDTFLATALVVTVGVPLFVFFNLITGGLFLLLAGGAVIITMLGLINYFLWGKQFSDQVAEERSATDDYDDWPDPPNRTIS